MLGASSPVERSLYLASLKSSSRPAKTGPKNTAAAPSGQVSAPSFDAPEGTYAEISLPVPFLELPLSLAVPFINANIANSSNEASPPSASTPASTIILTASPAASPSLTVPSIQILGSFIGLEPALLVSTQGSNTWNSKTRSVGI